VALLAGLCGISAGAACAEITGYTVTELPVPGSVHVAALNDLGQVAGRARDPFYWDGTITWYLPSSSDTIVSVRGMNDAGAVVGDLDGVETRGFLWQDGAMRPNLR
jgi:hypothetical protein